MTMRARRIATCLLAFPLCLVAAVPASKPDIQLWRLDCGVLWTHDLDEMSDTRAYVGQSMKFVGSCYLIRHGSDYMLWDTGLPREYLGKPYVEGDVDSNTFSTTVVEQLAKIGIKPAQVSRIGISHYHLDHVGQAADFPQAKLLIGEGDFAVLGTSGHEARTKLLSPWLRNVTGLEKVKGDFDVFGDGSVVMLDLPGHTPGHHGLLVTLPKLGAVLLSGDAVHFRENMESAGVPSFNTDRAQSLSSIDRLSKLARNLDATLIIQHEERDLAKLPAFPDAAE